MVFTPIQLITSAIGLVAFLLFVLSKLYIRRLKKYYSPISGLVEVWQRPDGEKYLTINGAVQGISIDQPSIKASYWYFIAEKVLKHCKTKHQPHVLFLGLGANTSSLLISRQNTKIQQTIIEIDQLIIDACHHFFQLDKLKNYLLIHGNVHELINKRGDFNGKFDTIVVDVFSGEPPFVSLETNKSKFIKKLREWGKKDALLIFNRHADTPEAKKIGQDLYNYLNKNFSKPKLMYIKDPRGYRNYVITVKV